MPEQPRYVATLHGIGPTGGVVYRVVDMRGHVCYVTIPQAHSTSFEVDETINSALDGIAPYLKPSKAVTGG